MTTPAFFVARDRARRVGWNLEKVLQERRLAWRGADVGMASLTDEADRTLAAIAADARESIEAVLEGRIRDRERGYMEVPFTVAMNTVATRAELAAELETRRRLTPGSAKAVERQIADHLTAALRRLEAFQATYDEKRPLGAPHPTDVAHVLTLVALGEGRPWDEAPPRIDTDAAGLEDLLLAIVRALPEGSLPWRVRAGADGRTLELALGCGAAHEARDLPAEVERATRVLAYLHPVRVVAHGAADAPPTGYTVRLEDPTGGDVRTTVAALAGAEATLSPAAETAARALAAAPPLPEHGPPPPGRLVALLGLLRVLDGELKATLEPRVETASIREAATALPREATRKAPLRPRLVDAFAATFPDLLFGRASDLLAGLLPGKKLPRLGATELAILLAFFGRAWHEAGASGDPRIERGGLDDEGVEALIRDLATLAPIRQKLEGGREVTAAEITRLECATLGALGRLGRMGRKV